MENFNIGEIVWAKIRGYPYWPAKILEAKDDNKEKKFKVGFIGDNTHAIIPKQKIAKFMKEFKEFSKTKKKTLQESIIRARELYDQKYNKLDIEEKTMRNKPENNSFNSEVNPLSKTSTNSNLNSNSQNLELKENLKDTAEVRKFKKNSELKKKKLILKSNLAKKNNSNNNLEEESDNEFNKNKSSSDDESDLSKIDGEGDNKKKKILKKSRSKNSNEISESKKKFNEKLIHNKRRRNDSKDCKLKINFYLI